MSPVAGQGPHAFLGSCEGVVSKQGQRPLQRSRSLWRVLRRRGGVDRAALERRVREAMDADPPPYHPTRSNCVHFALSLLGQGPSLDPLGIEGSALSSVSAARLPGHHPTPPPSRLRLHRQLTRLTSTSRSTLLCRTQSTHKQSEPANSKFRFSKTLLGPLQEGPSSQTVGTSISSILPASKPRRRAGPC